MRTLFYEYINIIECQQIGGHLHRDRLFLSGKRGCCVLPNRPLQMEFEDQLNALIYHLEEHKSGRHLLQALNEDYFARDNIAPKAGIKKNSFFEAINSR